VNGTGAGRKKASEAGRVQLTADGWPEKPGWADDAAWGGLAPWTTVPDWSIQYGRWPSGAAPFAGLIGLPPADDGEPAFGEA